MVDVGRDHELFSVDQAWRQFVPTKLAKYPCTFYGVGGDTVVDNVANTVGIDDLGFRVDAYVIENCFAVVSVDKRCREDKLDLVWLGSKGLPPHFVRPDGSMLLLGMRVDIAYLHSGTAEAAPRPQIVDYKGDFADAIRSLRGNSSVLSSCSGFGQ